VALVLVVALLALERWGPSDGPTWATPGSVSSTRTDPDEPESASVAAPESAPTSGDECTVSSIAADIGDDESDTVIGVPRCRDGFAVAIAGSLDRVGPGPIVVAYELTPEGWSELARVPLGECGSLGEVEPTFPVELC
jgi:hypothetical protein